MNVPTTMRAWRLHQYGAPIDVLRLESVAVPTPDAGELLVQVEAFTLNFNDLERIGGGNMMVVPAFPYSPGMEVTGRVVAAGDPSDPRIGARVVGTTKGAHGGYADFAICLGSGSFAIPDDIALPDAAALFFPYHLAWLGLYDRADLQPGQTVLIHAGAGGSGSAAIQLAKHRGARVIATAGGPHKVEVCRSIGADLAIDYLANDFADAVLAATDGVGVDIVFDNVGESVFESSLKCTRYNGQYLMMGFASNKVVADEPFVVPRRLALGNLKLGGVLLAYADEAMAGFLKTAMGWNFAPAALGQRITDEIVSLYRAGVVRPRIGAEVGFADAPQAITAMRDRDTIGRIVVRTDQ